MLGAAIGIGVTLAAFETEAWPWLISSIPIGIIGLYVVGSRLSDRLRGTDQPSLRGGRNLILALLGTVLALTAGLTANRMIVAGNGGCGTVSSGRACDEETGLLMVGFFGSLFGSIGVTAARSGAKSRDATDPARPGPRPSSEEAERRLLEIEELRTSGAISERECADARQRVLDSM